MVWLAVRLLGIIAALGAALPARAVTLVYEFEATVTALTADRGLFGAPGTVAIGAPVTGRLAYEVGPGNPDQLPADPEHGGYELAELGVDPAVIALSEMLVAITHEPGLPTLPPAPPDPGTDRFSAAAMAPGYGIVRLSFEGPFGAAFADDSLPNPLVLADFETATLQGLVAIGLEPGTTIHDLATVTSLTLVPEPGPAASLLALATLLAIGRRARAS